MTYIGGVKKIRWPTLPIGCGKLEKNMTVPADGVPRLMHFVDARLAKLRMSREEANRRGFPNFSTLAAVRDRDTQNTPRVRTLLRIDRTLLAARLGGGRAVGRLSAEHHRTRHQKNVRLQEQAATPLTEDDIADRLLTQLHEEIERAHDDLRAFDDRINRLYAAHDRLAEELRVDRSLVEEFADRDVAAESVQR